MTHIDSGNYDPLVWVQNEVQQTLAEALNALNIYIDSSEDSSFLDTCIGHIHQVNGTIAMLNLPGAMLLSKEMLSLATALRNQPVQDAEQSYEVLIRSLLILPNYLKLIANGLSDHPLCIIDIVNELKTARHEPIIKPIDIFKPVLSVHLPNVIAPDPTKQSAKLNIPKDKINHAFQVYLLRWLRHEDSESLTKINTIIHYLRLISTQERNVVLWWTAEAILEALIDQSMTLTPEIKLHLGKLNQSIKILSENDEEKLLALFPTELVHNLLLLVAKFPGKGKYNTALKDTFRLDFFDHQQQIYGMSTNALTDVHTALLEQLNEVKEQVEQYGQDSNQNADTKAISIQLQARCNITI